MRQHGWCLSTASLGSGVNFNGGSFRVLTWLRQWRSIVTVQLVPGPRRRLGVPAFFQAALCISSAQHHAVRAPMSKSAQRCSAIYPHTAFICRSCLHPADQCPSPPSEHSIKALQLQAASARQHRSPIRPSLPANLHCPRSRIIASTYILPVPLVLAYVLSLSRQTEPMALLFLLQGSFIFRNLGKVDSGGNLNPMRHCTSVQSRWKFLVR